MPYNQRTEKEILGEMLRYGIENGLLNFDDTQVSEILEGEHTGNQYVLDLDVHAFAESKSEEIVEEIYNNIFINLAKGVAINNFGDLLGVPRRNGVPALVGIQLSTSTPVSNDVTVPAGTSLILDDIYSDVEYVTRDEIVLAQGTSSVSGYAVSLDERYLPSLPRGMVRGLQGFSTISCTNEDDGSHGRDIESDDDYRLRIQNWLLRNVRGSGEIFDDYLLNYPGLDSYKLVPLYDGVGSLKIVVDALPSELENIAEGVQQNCSIKTDKPVVCVLPTAKTLTDLILNCTVGDNNNLTYNELKQIISVQVQTFVEGGYTRDGSTYTGMKIGENFIPGKLIKYILEQVPELENLYLSTTENDTVINIYSEIEVDDLEKFSISMITVVL